MSAQAQDTAHSPWAGGLARVQDGARAAAPWFAVVMAFGIPWSRVFYRVGLVGLLACLVLGFSWQLLTTTVRRERLCQLALVFFAFMALGLLYTTAPAEFARYDVSRYIKVLAIIPLAMLVPREAWARKVVVAYAAGVLVLMLPTLLEGFGVLRWTGWDLSGIRDTSYLPTSRVYWRNHIVHGFHVAMLLVVCLATLRDAPRWRPALILVAGLCMLDVLAFIAARTALIALAVVLLLAWLDMRRPAWVRAAGVAALVLAALGAYTVSPSLKARVDSVPQQALGFFEEGNVQTSAGARLKFWSMSLDLWKRAPILGTGPGSFRNGLVNLDRPSDGHQGLNGLPENERQRLHAHNQYLSLLSQDGVVGLGLFLALLAVAWRQGSLQDRRGRSLVHWGLIVFAINAMTDASLHNEWEGWTLVLWLWLAGCGPGALSAPAAAQDDASPRSAMLRR